MSPDQPDGPDGIHGARVAQWLTENVDSAHAPFRFTAIIGGNSNLTFRVDDEAGHAFALRRPPLNSVLATAHDMSREWRVIHALQHSSVPVPRTLGFCSDLTVTGAPFYVMAFVDGVVQHSRQQTVAAFTSDQRRTSGQSLFDVLAELHAVDIDEVGLGEHGPRENYLERQLNRWYRQYNETKTTAIRDVDSAFARLLEARPNSADVTIVHGDYRLGNCITGADGRITAVLDWEISTLGDPLADLAYCLNDWARPDNAVGRLADSADLPTMADGFDSAAAMLARYADRSGRDVTGIGYYVAFNHWRYACIVQGVLSRYRSGALGRTDEVDLDGFAHSVELRAALANDALDDIENS